MPLATPPPLNLQGSDGGASQHPPDPNPSSSDHSQEFNIGGLTNISPELYLRRLNYSDVDYLSDLIFFFCKLYHLQYLNIC